MPLLIIQRPQRLIPDLTHQSLYLSGKHLTDIPPQRETVLSLPAGTAEIQVRTRHGLTSNTLTVQLTDQPVLVRSTFKPVWLIYTLSLGFVALSYLVQPGQAIKAISLLILLLLSIRFLFREALELRQIDMDVLPQTTDTLSKLST